MARRWIILAPEYPPALGGIAGYLGQLAGALAERADPVEVFSPAPAVGDPKSSVVVHELPRGFDRKARAAIRARLASDPSAVTLVEYVPRMLGPSAVAGITRLPGELWVMFHEVAYPFEEGQSLRLRALALGTHAVAAALYRRAARVLVSTPGCERALDTIGGGKPAFWLPIPSNLPTEVPEHDRGELLASVGLDATRPVVGHFSTFGSRVAEMLERVLEPLLTRDGAAQALLLGNGSKEFAERFLEGRKTLATRVRATGRLEAHRAAELIASSDVLVFPFPDGISSRRTSVMAALALGRPVVTNFGMNTEGVFERERCVELADDEAGMAERAVALLADAEGRRALGARARQTYESRFSLDVLVKQILRLRTVAPGTQVT